MSIKIIKPIQLNVDETSPFKNSLKVKGLTRNPGTSVYVLPAIDTANRIKTGIDEKSAKIRHIVDKAVREKEASAKLEARLRLQEATGYDLTPEMEDDIPKSLYYREIYDEAGYMLKDGDNPFDMSKPIDRINFAWLCESGLVARSLSDFESGKYPPGQVLFYVFEEDAEDKRTYQRVQKQDAAFSLLSNLSPQKRRKVAKLLGLGMSDTAIDEKVYNSLRKYISLPATSSPKDPLDNFNKWAQLSDDYIDVEYLINMLIDKNIIRVYGDLVKQGETTLAVNIEVFKNDLLDPGNLLRESLENKLDQTLSAVVI